MRNFRRRIARCFSSLLFFVPLAALATEAPPVGAWDCVVSGSEKGVINLFFNVDGTLSGRAILTYAGRTSGVFTNGGVRYTNFVGGAQLDGRWSYASPANSSRIVGFINGISSRAGTETLVTNGLSFSGTARGSRLTLQAKGYLGQLTLRGIPLESTNNLTGTYYGNAWRQGAPAPFTEVFVLTPAPEFELVTNSLTTTLDCSSTNILLSTDSYSVTNLDSIISITNYITHVLITQQVCLVTNTLTTTIINLFPDNYYVAEGGGPAYQYVGRLLVSRQNYAAFYQAQGVNDKLITVYAGSFNPATGRGSLVGTDGVSRNIKYVIAHGPL